MSEKVSSKDRKNVGEASSGPSLPKGGPVKSKNRPGRMYSYDSMPLNHKQQRYITDDVGGSVKRYTEIICWIRHMASYDGTVFDQIKSCHSRDGSYPLLEVEVITSENESAKFLIKKSDLYLIACLTENTKFQFDTQGDVYLDNTFTMLNAFSGCYEDSPWKFIGPDRIINAVSELHYMDADSMKSERAMRPYYNHCQVFFIHLCEAARMQVIQTIISDTFVPAVGFVVDNHTYLAEADRLFPTIGGGNIQEVDDIYERVKATGHWRNDLSLTPPPIFERYLHSYDDLITAWYVYSLSGGKIYRLKAETVERLNIRSVKSLRSTLGVLTSTNLNRILNDCWKKIDNKTEGQMTDKDYKAMHKRVMKLYEENKATNFPYKKAVGC